MKTSLLRNTLLILCALAAVPTCRLEAATIDSTYTGPIGGNWNNPANWSPPTVPNNSGTDMFNVTVDSEYPGVTLDLDVSLSNLTLSTTTDFSAIISTDHNLTSAATSSAGNFPQGGGFLIVEAQNTNVLANLGNLADFSGTTLNTGNYVVVADRADPGITATIQFNGADIRTSNGDVQLAGAASRIVDQLGNDALRHFQHNLVNGYFLLDTGRDFTTEGSFINEGEIIIESQFAGIDVPTTLMINGDYTGIGFPFPGLANVLAAGPIADATMVIRGNLTNYDAASKTLHETDYAWEAANGRSATTQVLGGSRPLNIVTSEASLILFGPNTGFRDRNGNDALRNLTTSARLFIGDRDFSTHGSFNTTSRLSVFGDAHFTVNGNMTVQSGLFEVSPLTGYAWAGFPDGFPMDPPYISSRVSVRGNFNLQSPSDFRVRIFDNSTLPTIHVEGAAIFAGSLTVSLLDGASVTSADSFTVLRAHRITGQFTNVANGGRITATMNGNPAGTFLVTYHRDSLVLSHFQPTPDSPQAKSAMSASGSDEDLERLAAAAARRSAARYK